MTVDSPVFAVLGRPFRCHIETSSVLAWLDRHWRRDEHVTPPHGYTVELVEGAGPADVAGYAGGAGGPADLAENAEGAGGPAGDGGRGHDARWEPEIVRLPDGITLSWARRANEWVWRGGEAYVHLRLGDDGARVRFRFGADVFPALYVAVSEALRASGLLPLHAAVVVRDGVASAIAAPSGTGKTTTLVRLLSRGWSPLAEDLSWLDPGTYTLYGWDRGLRLWSDGLARVGSALAAAPWGVDPDGKRFLDWADVGVPRVPRARLARVVLLQRDATRPTCLEPLSPREAVRVLWEATGVPLSPGVRAVVNEHVARLLRELEFQRLRLGPDSEADLPPQVLGPPQAFGG